ncbi:MAG: hypothetical protein KAH23_01415, partial [Kiritimatiellae bacterium]|nr:hypothetical protein [Kiritimatiellia bacterium]
MSKKVYIAVTVFCVLCAVSGLLYKHLSGTETSFHEKTTSLDTKSASLATQIPAHTSYPNTHKQPLSTPPRLPPGKMADPMVRHKVARQLQQKHDVEKSEALAIAKKEGWAPKNPVNEDDYELMAIRNGKVYEYHTENANAAISLGTDLIRNTAPYNLSGAGSTIGLWDAGMPLTTHQELTGRILECDTTATHNHSTHVAGTIAAAGINTLAQGMAPQITINAYEWNSDLAEMAATGMASSNET